MICYYGTLILSLVVLDWGYPDVTKCTYIKMALNLIHLLITKFQIDTSVKNVNRQED